MFFPVSKWKIVKAAENNEHQKFQPHEDIGIEFCLNDLIYSLEQKGHNTALNTANLYYIDPFMNLQQVAAS